MPFEIFLSLLRFLPTIIAMVEQINPQATPGAEKLSKAIAIAAAVLPAAHSSAMAAPEGQSQVITAINAIVAGMNAAGTMPSGAP